MARIFRKDAVLVAGVGCFPLLPSRRELFCRDTKLDQALLPVEGDYVAVFYERDCAPNERLRRDVPDDPTSRSPREASVGNESDRVEQSLADKRCRRRKYFRHARATFRAFIADDDDVASFGLLCENRL